MRTFVVWASQRPSLERRTDIFLSCCLIGLTGHIRLSNGIRTRQRARRLSLRLARTATRVSYIFDAMVVSCTVTAGPSHVRDNRHVTKVTFPSPRSLLMPRPYLRGSTNTLALVKKAATGKPVQSEKLTSRILEMNVRDEAFREVEQCEVLKFPLETRSN